MRRRDTVLTLVTLVAPLPTLVAHVLTLVTQVTLVLTIVLTQITLVTHVTLVHMCNTSIDTSTANTEA